MSTLIGISSMSGHEIRAEGLPVIWTGPMQPRWPRYGPFRLAGLTLWGQTGGRTSPLAEHESTGVCSSYNSCDERWACLSVYVSQPLPFGQEQDRPSTLCPIVNLSLFDYDPKQRSASLAWPPCVCQQCRNQLAFIKLGLDRDLIWQAATVGITCFIPITEPISQVRMKKCIKIWEENTAFMLFDKLLKGKTRLSWLN